MRRVLLAVCVLASAGCTYDFDSAFSSGVGGAGGTAGEGGTASGTATGTGSGTAAGTSTGMTGSEDCFNQIDDDDDGLVDCEDDDCLNGTCVPVAPEGWDHAGLLLAENVESLGDCLSPWMTTRDASRDLAAPEASCADCSCGAPNYACSTPTLTSYTNPNCSAGS